jgi:hypothetical protein
LPGIPVGYDGRVIYVGVIDRDVILALKGITFQTTDFAALNALNPMLCSHPSQNGCNYMAAASADFNLPGVPFPLTVRFERGFVGVDVVINDKSYRFVTTHLETRLETFGPQGRFYQAAQAAELDATLQVLQSFNTIDKTMVVGDFNSDSRDEVIPLPAPNQYLGIPPYQQFVGAGYTDVWTMRPGTATANGAPLIGFSCCQNADLDNHRSMLYERIDLIFSLAKPVKVQLARLLGESIADKTTPTQLGLWPSDHASVAARLTFSE